jgi:hypothetical protein
MRLNHNRYIAGGIGLLAALLLVACSPRLAPGTVKGSDSEAFMARPGLSERYALDEMVILSRHNIRSPISRPRIGAVADYPARVVPVDIGPR